MTSIAPAPTFNVPSRDQMLRTAFSMPFSPLREFWEQAQQSALTSPGLGTALRTLITPPSNTPPPVTTGYGPAADLLASPVNAIRSARYLLQGVLGRQPSLSPEQWQASPYYRKAIPYDPGMTEERAASLAWQHDLEQARAFMSDKQAWTGPFGIRLPSPLSFAGQFAGGMLDPVNYIPIFGQGARAAAVARFGVNGLARFGIELSVDAAEAAANSAVFMGLTAQERAKFGDDVSWQAQINNVAMSALIGAVMFPVGRMFGAAMWGSKAAANMAAERIAARNFKVPDVETARALMNDVVGSLVETGTPSVSRVTQSVVDKLVDKVAAESARGNPLRRLMAADAGAAPAVEGVPKVGGRWPTEAVSPSGARVQVQPEVVDLATLQRATGENQVRDTGRAANEAWRHETAATLDPARLMPSIEGDRGAPLVNGDNLVVGGNHRTDAIDLAYQAYPDSAAKYRKAIEDAGFSTDGMQKPVLINRIVTNMSPEETSAFAADLNTSATQRMSSTETAAMDRAALDDSTLKVLADGPIDSAANRAFVATFLGNLPRAERGALVEKDGTLNADGKRRIENALVADAYGDVDATVLRRFSESIDDNTRSVVGAMADVAGRWSLMRRAMKRGEIGAEFDTTAELTQALRSLAGWREDASAQKRPVSTVIKEGMAQLDMLGGGMSDEARAFVRMFYKTDEFSQSAGRDVIAGRLQKVVDSAEELGRPQLFDDGAAATKLGVLKNALNDEQGFIFADDGAGSSDGSGGQSRGAGAAGTDRGLAAQETVAGTGHRSVAERISERVVAAGRPEAEGKAIGQIVEAFYTTQAQRLGVPLAEFEAMFPLPEVRGPDAGGPALDVRTLAQHGLDVYRDVGGTRLQFDDEVQARVFDAGQKLAEINGIDKATAAADMSTARGAIELPEGTGPVIHILQGADASTALHEMGHYFLHILKQMGDQDTAPFALKRDVETLKGWWGDVADEVAADSPHDGVTADDVRAVLRDGTTGDRVKDLAIDVGFQEQWARAFEAYLRDGEAPTPGLRGLFEQFKAWLVDVYKRVTDLRVKLSPEVKGVMDRMLGGEDVSTRPGDMRTEGKPAESVAQGNSPEIPDSSQPALDFPMPEPPKPMEGAAAAEARLSTGSEDGAALREQFGLDESGGFAEQADIDLLEKQGLLSADDKAALKAADDEIAAAESWGDALMTAARCAFRF